MSVVEFTGKVQRAIVIVPFNEDGTDYCRAELGGWPADFELDVKPGPLWKVMMTARDWGSGLPINVHPECERRAAR